MGLTFEQKEELDRLSIKKDGFVFACKAEATSVPTVIIGLGGLGGITLNELKQKVLKNIDENAHFYFLAVDSDDICLKHLKKTYSEEGYLKDSETLNICSPAVGLVFGPGVGFHYPDWMRNPFPYTRYENWGAQGIRQIGRLILTSGDTYRRLRYKIEDLLMHAHHDAMAGGVHEIEVILVSGVSGGTGGGIIIDVAYMIRKIMENCGGLQCRLSAYLYAPDVHSQCHDPGIMNVLMRNGYATMKEIDYFMNLKNNHGMYRLNVEDEGCCESHENIFDTAMIINAVDSGGIIKSQNEIIHMLTENLTDMLTAVSVQHMPYIKKISEDKSISLSTWYGGNGADPARYPKSANYCYQTLGYMAAVIPMDEILGYGMNQLYQNMHEKLTSVQNVDKNMMKDILREVGLDDIDTLREIALKLAEGIPASCDTLPDNMLPSRSEIREMGEHLFDKVRESAYCDAAKLNSSDYRVKLKTWILNSLEEKLEEILIHEGPYKAAEILTHGMHGNTDTDSGSFEGIIPHMEYLKHSIFERQKNLEHSFYSCVRVHMEEKRQRASSFLGGKKAVREYVDFLYYAARMEIFEPALYRVLEEVLVQVIRELMDQYNRFWSVCTESLDQIGEILKTDAHQALDSSRPASAASCDIINLYEENQKSNHLKFLMDSFADSTFVSMLSASFVQSMHSKKDMWTGSVGCTADSFYVPGEVRSIFDGFLQNLLGYDMIDKIVAAAYYPRKLTICELAAMWQQDRSANGLSQALDQAAGEIQDFFNTQAGFMTGLNSEYSAGDFSVQTIVAAPHRAELTRKLFAGYPAGAINSAPGTGRVRYIYSQIVSGLPLYLIEGFQTYDAVYRDTNAVIGLHMDEVNQDWRRFPQPYILDAAAQDGVNYTASEDYRILMDVKEMADEAMEKYGFIRKNTPDGFPAENYTLYDVVEKPERDTFCASAAALLENYPYDGKNFTSWLEFILKQAGYRFEPVELKADGCELNPLDLEGTGRNIEIGDFYKLIRRNMYYMDLLENNLKNMEEVWEILGI